MGWRECASGVDIRWGLVSVGRDALVDVLFVVECRNFHNLLFFFFFLVGEFQASGQEMPGNKN